MPVSLRESVCYQPATLMVDEARCCLPNVKVLGFSSQNQRRYLREAVQTALPKYEDISVNVDHLPLSDFGTQHTCRQFHERFGWLENVQLRPDGLYGDLRYNPEHSLAKSFLWWARHKPTKIGLSHNAEGEVDDQPDGTALVTEISKVHSVDLVADPATTKGLYESRQVMTKIKLKALIEQRALKHPKLKKLLEMGDPYGSMDVSMPPTPGATTGTDEAEGDWKQHLVDAIGKLVQSDSPEDHETAKKIMAMLKPASALPPPAPDPALTPLPEEDEDPSDEGEDEEMLESLRRENRLLKATEHCRQLCESARIQPAPVLLKALIALPNDTDRRVLLEDYRKTQGTQRRRPVSAGYGAPPEPTLDSFCNAVLQDVE